MFKDMTDDALEAAIATTRALLFNAAEMKAYHQQGRLMRDLDIAIAVKRQRIKAGAWSPAGGPGAWATSAMNARGEGE